MATKPCTRPDAVNGKHKWEFKKNSAGGTLTFGAGGSRGVFKVFGLYACACGATRKGSTNRGAPGADLRDHVGFF
jgi:hypothetical protein